MKALEILKAIDKRGNFICLNKIAKKKVREAIAELEELEKRICCDNCQKFDSSSEICYQNGCKNFEDWELWTPKNKEQK